ncbi:cadherin repeat domain-containing protein [Candidatus Dojkabacteria bacterium]|uniref:Cadherin repeat domain-containing protein n=1 Tax=Candidatus Dojkabacteria bacterium TaxID=2099670 RepID=A0A847D1J9_9BACT|nr:cadherin repeat domain-containing protein [Candidatus Dojkabacteria bacterium]
MKGKNYLLSGLIALFLLFGLIAPQAAEARDIIINAIPTLAFDPATETATTCGNVEVSLVVADVPETNPLTAYHLEVTFDQSVVEVVSVENGGFLQGDLLEELTNDEGNETGRLIWGVAQQAVAGMNAPRSGDGSLIKITLKAKVAGGSTTFVIDSEKSLLIDWPDAFEVDYSVGADSVVTTTGCAPTGLALSPDFVKENELAGTIVGNFSATDEDVEEIFTYSLIDDGTYPDNSLFTIDGAVLKTAVIFDHEEDDTRLIKVRVTDTTELTYDREFSISIMDINEVPIIDPIGLRTVVENETLTFTATATDPEEAALTWSLGESAPTGATINPATGEFSWDTAGFELGDYSFDVCVSDGVYLICETITVTIEVAPDPLPIKIYLPLIYR